MEGASIDYLSEMLQKTSQASAAQALTLNEVQLVCQAEVFAAHLMVPALERVPRVVAFSESFTWN